MLKNTEGTIQNEQSRELATGRRKIPKAHYVLDTTVYKIHR